MAKQTVKLGVNVDHVATLRQARLTPYPDPVQAAQEAEQAGADGITLHLREDRRHIQDRDLERLRRVLQTKMNLEMAVTPEMLAIAAGIRPRDCCLVPERREELTTEGGLEVAGQLDRIAAACAELHGHGIRVSLFIDADLRQVEAAAQADAPVIELHTGHFADAKDRTQRAKELARIRHAVERGLAAGLQVNAGHGLNYDNVQTIAAIPGVTELNIGHAIVARALFVGFQAAVREMKRLISGAHGT